MTSPTEHLTLAIPARMNFRNIRPKVAAAVTDGRFGFGPGERIFRGEFDEERPKRE